MNLLNLEFFDKFGESYNFKYNASAGYWEGKEWLREISVSLFDSINIFVLENSPLGDPPVTKYRLPMLNPGDSLYFKWANAQNDTEFFMYDVLREAGTGNQFMQKTDLTEVKYSDFSTASASYLPAVSNILATTSGQNVNIIWKYLMPNWGISWRLWANSSFIGTPVQSGTVTINSLNLNTLTAGQYSLQLRTDSFNNPQSYAIYNVMFEIGVDTTTHGYTSAVTLNPLDVSVPMQVNVAFNPSSEKSFSRTLEAYYQSGGVHTKILELEFYGEGVEEDERFKVWGENFGIKFNTEDALILKDYDLKEGIPDIKQLNQIRKELLVSKDQIFPYVGTYKALSNFTNLMGYKDVLRVKEYWKNRNTNSEYFDKMALVDITDFMDDGTIDDMNLVDANRQIKFTNQFKKTSFIALVYEFTMPTGNYDDDGIPEVEKTTEFTVNEIFFKLNKLGKKLKREILPLNVQIKDIIGEFIFFERYSMRYWTDRTDIEDLEISKHLDLQIKAPDLNAMGLTMMDIKALYSKKDNFFAVESFNNYDINPFDDDQRYDPTKVQDLIKSIEDFYNAHIELSYTDTGRRPSWESYDEPHAKIGCPIILEANMPDYTLDSLDGVTVQSMGQNRITVGSVKYANYYEVEWKIRKIGSNPYKFAYRGPVNKLGKLPHIFPSVGEYEVECRLYDVFGGVAYKYKKISVKPYAPVIIGVMRLEDKFNYAIENLGNVTVSDLDGSYVFNPRAIVLDNNADHKTIDVDKKLLEWPTYSNNYGFDFNMFNVEIELEDGIWENYAVSTNPYKRYWGTANNSFVPKINDYAGATVEDLFHSKLYDMSWQADFQNGFYVNLSDLTVGKKIKIGDYSPFTLSTYTTNDELLAQLNVLGIPGVSEFSWSIVGTKLHAQAKYHSKQLHNIWEII